jgi:hypothetical protein
MFGIGFAGVFLISQKRANSVRTVVLDTIARSATSTSSTTPLDLQATTTVPDSTPPTTNAPDTTLPDTLPPPTEPPRSAPAPSTDGAILSATSPGSNEARPLSSDASCSTLSLSGNADQCDITTIGLTSVAWVYDADGVDLLVQDPDIPDVYRVQLHSGRISTKPPRFVDVTGDGVPEMLLGWRADDNSLNVDIVEVREGSLVVSLHISLADGHVSAGGGSIDVWDGIPGDGETSGHANGFDHYTYSKDSGRWIVSEVDRDDRPPTGQF